MATYSDVAVRAILKLRTERPASPREAWDSAAAEVFPGSVSLQEKGCPRTTFLFLCTSGAVEGVLAGAAMRQSENVRHAQDCLTLLARHPDLVAMNPRKLWNIVTNGSGKAYNQQMHVILGLAQANLLRANACGSNQAIDCQ